MSKAKFKVGDRVVRNRASLKNEQGTIAEVRYSESRPKYNVRWDKEPELLCPSWQDHELELVSPRSAQLDVKDMNIDELIECANRGQDATKRLYQEYDTKVNFLNSKFERLKPQKTFQAYTIESTGWDVSVHVDDVHIGCKIFSAKDLASALRALIVEEKPFVFAPNRIDATVRGARYEGHTLPWDDAQLLMKKLEDYLDKSGEAATGGE